MVAASLFEICLDYIAKNIRHVESFRGFPDTVAEKIYHAVEGTGQLGLKNPTESFQILSLFTTAFAEYVLTAVNMEGDHLLLADCLDHLMLFSHIRGMDMSCCCLGDEHDLLFHISTLKSLKVLVLRNNDLTDEGIRKLTAPIRVKKTGPLCLHTLDLSGNREVTVKSVKFLRVFRELKLLNLSCTGIQDLHYKHTVPELQDYAQGRCLAVVTAAWKEVEEGARLCRDMTTVKNQGWAANLLSLWTQDRRLPHQTVASTDTEAQRFYGKSRNSVYVTTMAAASSSSSKERKESSSPSLLLIHSSLLSPSVSSTPPLSEVSLSSSLSTADGQSHRSALSSSDLIPGPRSKVGSSGPLTAATQPPGVGLSAGLPPVTTTVSKFPTHLPTTRQLSDASFPSSEVPQNKFWRQLTPAAKGLAASSAGSRLQTGEKQGQSATACFAPFINSREGARSQSKSSCTFTFQDAPRRLSSRPKHSGGTPCEENESWTSVARTDTSRPSVGVRRIDAIQDLSGALLGRSKGQCAATNGVDGHRRGDTKSSVHGASVSKRGQEHNRGRECSQQKKVCVDRDLGREEDLTLLRQYGYS